MKQTLKLGISREPAIRRAEAIDAGRPAIEISLGSAEGLRIVRRRQPAIVWRRSARPGPAAV